MPAVHFKEMATQSSNRVVHLRRGITLEYLTLGWNLLECVVAILAGIHSGSISLLGFGVDSAIESASGSVLLWRLHAERKGADLVALERRSLRMVGISFFLLAAYVAYDSAASLIRRHEPESSSVGIVLAVLSLIAMPLLAWAKRTTAANLKSGALHADSRQTSLCAYLSVILLVGLTLNATLGWWWADPVAGLLMVPIVVKEGLEALRGRSCADCH
jgi:divalent metal cation (Fe/Co/Zn/Cd) transporter